MLHVELDNIFSEDDAVTKARELIDHVDTTKQIVVVTRGNRPAVVMIDIDQLEQLTGRSVTPVAPMSAQDQSAPLAPAPDPIIPTSPAPGVALGTNPTPEPTPTPSNPLPPLPDMPDMPMSPMEAPMPLADTTPATPTMPSTPPMSYTEPSMPPAQPPVTPPPSSPPAAPNPSTPPAQPTPPAPAPMTPPAGMDPRLLSSNQDGLPPEDLNNSSPLG